MSVNPIQIFIAACVGCMLISSCDSQEAQAEFEQDANMPASGIVRTDENGVIIKDESGNDIENDSDDWRTSPSFAGLVRMDPAYPNPTRGELVAVPVIVQQFNALPGGLVLRGFDNTGRLVLLDALPQATQPGAYTFIFSPVQFSVSLELNDVKGIHRVFVFASIGSDVVSYGDIRVE